MIYLVFLLGTKRQCDVRLCANNYVSLAICAFTKICYCYMLDIYNELKLKYGAKYGVKISEVCRRLLQWK